jgi:hypothetical protein
VTKAAEPQICAACAGAGRATILVRTPKPPTSQVTEVLDNGAMPKRLERLADAERLYRERAEADSLKSKE